MKLDQKSQRIMAIDLLRGYFLFVIIIDHLMRFPGIFEILTGRGKLWVSAAEGFFFVSGMMVGLIRGRKMINLPFREVSKKLLERSLKLYLWAIGLTIIFTLVGLASLHNPHLKDGISTDRNIWHTVWQTATFQYAYGWADFLQYYAIYLALSPIVIWLLRKRLWLIVLSISSLLWLLRGYNIYLAWQILFFFGTVTGFYLKEIEQTAKKFRKNHRNVILLALLFLSIITFVLSNIVVNGTSISVIGIHQDSLKRLNDLAVPYFLREKMNLSRLLLFTLWFTTAYCLVRKYEKWLVEKVGKLFIPLGQNSLYVYIWQAIIIFFLDLVTPVKSGFTINLITNVAVIGIIWLMVQKKFLFKIIPR